MSTSNSIFLLVCTAVAFVVEANTFLKAVPNQMADRLSEQDVQTSLLAEIEVSLGSSIAAKRISDIEGQLRPTFISLPKNQHGNLDHVTTRYALHRVFIQRHGWAIKGLDPAGEAWDSSSPTGILKNQVPSYIQNLFEKRLGGRGLGLHELTMFAATIEHLIHNEAIGRLGSALQIYDLLPTSVMTADEADKVLDTYLMAYITGQHLSNMSSSTAQSWLAQMPEVFSTWKETQAFVRKVRHDVTNGLGNGVQHQLEFATLVRVAETIGEEFGAFQNADCKLMKANLMKIEDRGSGRVRLSDFYKPAVDDNGWQFTESVGYLRQLGALDESNPGEPRVMLPNYLGAQSNCIASSDYYSVCCINECEDLLGHLEKDIAAPEAKPARILELISGLPSSSVPVTRIASATLRTRLEQIATEHGGLVQLHSRLFNQWMHHAYPRECPFPHVAGTTSQTKPMDWAEANGADAIVSNEALSQFTSASNSTNEALEEVDDLHDLMMWTHEEELLVVRAPSVPEVNKGSSYFVVGVRNVALMAALVSFAFSIVRTSTAAAGSMEKEQKYLV